MRSFFLIYRDRSPADVWEEMRVRHAPDAAPFERRICLHDSLAFPGPDGPWVWGHATADFSELDEDDLLFITAALGGPPTAMFVGDVSGRQSYREEVLAIVTAALAGPGVVAMDDAGDFAWTLENLHTLTPQGRRFFDYS